MNEKNIAVLSQLNRPVDSGNGGGGHIEERLRQLEIEVARIDERVKAVQENMVTKSELKAEISNLKNWILGGILGAIVTGATIAALVVKAFF